MRMVNCAGNFTGGEYESGLLRGSALQLRADGWYYLACKHLDVLPGCSEHEEGRGQRP
jgi:hypothetical protein